MYYPMWFREKLKHCFTEGPKHVLKQLELVRLHSEKVQNLVAPHVARSAWFSHSKDVLLAFLCSQNKEERMFAVLKIVEMREGR